MDSCQWPFPVTCAGELVLKICNIESDTLWCLLTAIHDGLEHFHFKFWRELVIRNANQHTQNFHEVRPDDREERELDDVPETHRSIDPHVNISVHDAVLNDLYDALEAFGLSE